MPKAHLFRNLLVKFRRKEKDEAAKVGPASTTTTTSQAARGGSSTFSGGGTPTCIAEQVQVAVENQEIAVGPMVRNTAQVVSKEKFGMFYFTNKTPTPEQTIDLVAIHGLGGHFNETWTDKNTSQNWLRDFLPGHTPQLRIMSWGYNSEVLGSTSVGNVTIFAQGLLVDLKTCRATKALEKRPLIFVCHSLGGVVFKRMLALAHERARLYQATLQSIKGVVFLGTPHAGSDLASMLNWLAKIAKVASFGHTNSQLVEALKSQGDDLLEISESFVERGEHLGKIYSFFELEKLYGSIVVTKGSARIGLSNEELVPMDCSHSTICKFSGPESRQYERVLSKLQELVEAINDTSEFTPDTALQEEVLKSLEKYGYNPRQYSISDEHQSTFRWIWKSAMDDGPGFVDWVESGSGLFWIAGKPGAGKSTLMKYITNSEQTSVLLRKRGDNIKKLVFCFFELGEPHEKIFLGFLHSFLYQLVRSFPVPVHVILSIYREIQSRSTEHDPQKLDWNQDDTRRALKAISKQSLVHGQVCMFIDGLDECDGGATNTDDIDFIVNLQNWKAISISICISSRPELPIQLRLGKFSNLLVQQWTSGDVGKYVSKDLQTSFELAYPQATPTSYSAILTYLTNTLVQKAEGVFLWVKLVVKELKIGIEGYVRDDDLKSILDSLPKGIDDLYGTIFAKILPEDLHHAINYLESLSKSYSITTLHDVSFIEEGPQAALDRPFAAIPIEERIERCRKTKGRVVRCTRNLLEFRENHSKIEDGYLSQGSEDSESDDEQPSHEDLEDDVHNLGSISGIPRDESADIVSHEGQLTMLPGGSSASSVVQEPLLRMQVSFVHRTLQEYMNRDAVWEPTVRRASKDMLIDPHLSMLACTLSKIKTSPSSWRMRPNLSMRRNIHYINGYIRNSEDSNTTHCVFLESMATSFKNRFSNWTEFWGLSKDWGCSVQCVLARGAFKLHLKEAFAQKRVDKCNLPHPLTHYSLPYYDIDGSETFQLLLQNGCQVVDPFLGRSAWEYLLLGMSHEPEFVSVDKSSELEICRISLEKGANPNLVIQPITAEKFPLDTHLEMEGEIPRYKLPCYPLHMIIEKFNHYENLAGLFQTIKKFLEYGARLDVENADGETVLDNAAHWTFAGRPWNFAPILLRLQRECKIALKDKADSVPDSEPRDTILDLLDFSTTSFPYAEVADVLESLLAKLEKEGYGYVSNKGNGSPDSSTPSESDNSDESTHVTALKEESTPRPGSSLSDTGVKPSVS